MTTIRAALLLSLLLPVSQAGAQEPDVVAPALGLVVTPALESRGYVGEVRCVDGAPVSTVDAGRAEQHGIDRGEVQRHEAAHVAQLLAACDSTLALWARDPVARLDAEVQATCTGIAANVYPDTAQRSRRRNNARVALSMLYGAAVSFGQVYEAFERWCER